MSEASDKGNPDRPQSPAVALRRWLRRSAAIAGVAGIVMVLGGELVGSEISLYLGILLLAAGIVALVLWWIIFLAMWAERRGRWATWPAVLVVATACCLALGAYELFWQSHPFLSLDPEAERISTPAQMREICHRRLLWNPHPHDEFIFLIRDGDESSLPYIAWAFRWRPPPTNGGESCTWLHGIKALTAISERIARERSAATDTQPEDTQTQPAASEP